MSDVMCPFDDDFCQKKQDRFDEWKQFFFKNPHLVHRTTNNMFADCPIKYAEERKETCERYSRYCRIVDKTMNGVTESLKQMIRDKTISVDYEQIKQNLVQTDNFSQACISMAQCLTTLVHRQNEQR